MIINPTERRDQHCKIYVEKCVKKEIDKYATRNHLSFSEAGRNLMIYAIEHIEGV
jgi:rRNA-processing protein FCF1